MSFTHLHLHTEYSLLDGACRIPKLVERIKALGMTSCAITDHGVMYGCIDFYSAMKDAGIKPIIGCEVYVCRDRLDKSAANREYSHLILLCENNTGYQNLMKLVSEGFLTGYYYRPRIDYNLIRQHSEGLICLSACLSGDLPKLLLQGRYDDAEAYVREMQDIFGEKSFYVEIMDHGIREEKIVMPRLISLAREMNVPLVATNDCHYLEEKDADAQEVLLCIQTGKTLDDANRMRMDTRQLYVKSEDEMRTLFAACPDAVDRTQEIADRCNVEFEFGVTRLPHYPVPEGETALSMLTRLTHEGLRERYPDAKEDDEPWQRLNYELNVISSMGYVDYFLIVWDFIRYAKSQGIMVGPGRGSGAGSIVAYSLGITMLDPLKYQLLFERFLNPERVTMPDIDVDFCYERRQEVIDYVARKYGADHVSQIITFGTLQAKGCIRDVGRVLGMSYQDTDAVAKAIPFDLGMTLEKALTLSPLLKTMYDEQPEVHRLIDTAMTLEGMPRHASTHAAGVLITGKPVMEYVPLQRNDEVITTQYPMGTDEVAQAAAQIINPLPHGRERHARRNADTPRQRVAFAQNSFEDGGFSAPVRADKRQPLTLTQRKPHVFADCPIPVANRAVFHRNQHVFRMRQRRHAQRTDLLDVFQQRLLFLDGAFLPHLRCFRALHHPLRRRAEKAAVYFPIKGLIRVALVFLRAIAPFRRFARGGFQLLDFFAERLVPGGFGFVFAV